MRNRSLKHITENEVKDTIKLIKERFEQGSYEAAEALENLLHENVLYTIATAMDPTAEYLQRLAKLALSTHEIWSYDGN